MNNSFISCFYNTPCLAGLWENSHNGVWTLQFQIMDVQWNIQMWWKWGKYLWCSEQESSDLQVADELRKYTKVQSMKNQARILLHETLEESRASKSLAIDWSERTSLQGWGRLCIPIRHDTDKAYSDRTQTGMRAKGSQIPMMRQRWNRQRP